MTPDELRDSLNTVDDGEPVQMGECRIYGRRIVRNSPLGDGSPAREDGFRAFVSTIGPDLTFARVWSECGVLQRRVHRSPLFNTEKDAAEWMPKIMMEIA